MTGEGDLADQLVITRRPVLCRPAAPSDRAQVMEFLKGIWNGEDYVPDVWERWLNLAKGVLAVAERGGRVVGMGHLADLGLGESWLEGLRVDPRRQGQHIASHLHQYLLNCWVQSGSHALRLASAAGRKEVHHMCRKSGLEKVGSIVEFQAITEGGWHGFEPLAARGLDEALETLKTSPATRFLHGLIDIGWRFVSIRRPRLEPLVEQGRIWSCPKPRGLVALRIKADDSGTSAVIQTLAAMNENLEGVLRQVVRLARHLGAGKLKWLAPEEDTIMDSLEAAGYTTDWKEPVYLFERFG